MGFVIPVTSGFWLSVAGVGPPSGRSAQTPGRGLPGSSSIQARPFSPSPTDNVQVCGDVAADAPIFFPRMTRMNADRARPLSANIRGIRGESWFRLGRLGTLAPKGANAPLASHEKLLRHDLPILHDIEAQLGHLHARLALHGHVHGHGAGEGASGHERI